MKKLIEKILISLNERKERALFNAWLRAEENKRHDQMIREAEYLASRPACTRPIASNEAIVQMVKKAA